MNSLTAALSCVILVACASNLQAQQPPKTPLVIVCSCDDMNSRMFESAVRDAVAASPRYIEVRPDQAKSGDYRLVLVTIDDTSSSIALSIVVLHGETFMTSGVRVCGANKLAWCASNVLASADHAIQNGQGSRS